MNEVVIEGVWGLPADEDGGVGAAVLAVHVVDIVAIEQLQVHLPVLVDVRQTGVDRLFVVAVHRRRRSPDFLAQNAPEKVGKKNAHFSPFFFKFWFLFLSFSIVKI